MLVPIAVVAGPDLAPDRSPWDPWRGSPSWSRTEGAGFASGRPRRATCWSTRTRFRLARDSRGEARRGEARRGGAVPVLIAEQSPLSGHHAGLGTLVIRCGDDCAIAAKRSVRTKTTIVLRRKQLIGSALGRCWTALADRLTRAGQQAAHAVARRRSRRPIERSNLCPAGRDAEAPPGSLRS